MTNLMKSVAIILTVLSSTTVFAGKNTINSAQDTEEDKAAPGDIWDSSKLLNMIDRSQLKEVVEEAVKKVAMQNQDRAFSCNENQYFDPTSTTCEDCDTLCQLANPKYCQMYCPWVYMSDSVESEIMLIWIAIGVVGFVLLFLCLWNLINCTLNRKRNRSSTPSLPGYSGYSEKTPLALTESNQAPTESNFTLHSTNRTDSFSTMKATQANKVEEPQLSKQEEGSSQPSEDTTYGGGRLMKDQFLKRQQDSFHLPQNATCVGGQPMCSKFPPNNFPPSNDQADETITKTTN